jgi:pilus assembly protein CpaF
MNTGHDGSLTTIHANSPREAISRIEVMLGMANSNMSVRAIRQQITSAVDLFVQVARFSDGTRRVTHVTECVGMEGEMATTQDIFLFEKSGITPDGRVTGRFRATGVRPKFYEKLRAAGFTLPATTFQTIVELSKRVSYDGGSLHPPFSCDLRSRAVGQWVWLQADGVAPKAQGPTGA